MKSVNKIHLCRSTEAQRWHQCVYKKIVLNETKARSRWRQVLLSESLNHSYNRFVKNWITSVRCATVMQRSKNTWLCLKCRSLNINFLFSELLYKISINHAVIMNTHKIRTLDTISWILGILFKSISVAFLPHAPINFWPCKNCSKPV